MSIVISVKHSEKREKEKWRGVGRGTTFYGREEVPPLKVPRQCPLVLLVGGKVLGYGLCYAEGRS
jgi:hypothetical protein